MCIRALTAMVALVAIVSGAAAPAAQPRPGTARDRLVGTWHLVTYQILDPDGGPSRPGAYDVGRITYDPSGHMSAQLMHSSNKATQPPATDADRAAAYRRYLGYFGPFTVDEAKSIVTHHVAGSSNPAWVGSNQVRHFAFSPDGNGLTLSLKSGERVTQSLYWERVK
ncbi:MAG: lipocalin-like domain-containing protein [Vicinamibacterales bacterium]